MTAPAGWAQDSLRESRAWVLGRPAHDRKPLTPRTRAQVFEALPEDVLAYLQSELDFFSAVTSISGELYPVPKDERKAGAVRLAKRVCTARRCRETLRAAGMPHCCQEPLV